MALLPTVKVVSDDGHKAFEVRLTLTNVVAFLGLLGAVIAAFSGWAMSYQSVIATQTTFQRQLDAQHAAIDARVTTAVYDADRRTTSEWQTRVLESLTQIREDVRELRGRK